MILPVLALGAFWYLFILVLRPFRRKPRKESSISDRTPTVDEILAKYGTVPQPGPQAAAPPAPERPPLPLTSPWVLGPEAHERGAPESQPFGEDITSPDSREIPAAFRGIWDWEHQKAGSTDHRITIEADRYQVSSYLGMQPVIAVRLISDTEIAIVSQSVENGKWQYSLQYLGLLDGGALLTDLESMDMKWRRG